MRRSVTSEAVKLVCIENVYANGQKKRFLPDPSFSYHKILSGALTHRTGDKTVIFLTAVYENKANIVLKI